MRDTKPLPPAWAHVPVHRVITMPSWEIAAVIIEPNLTFARLMLSGTSRQIYRACMPTCWFHPARIEVQILDWMPRANRIAAALNRPAACKGDAGNLHFFRRGLSHLFRAVFSPVSLVPL